MFCALHAAIDSTWLLDPGLKIAVILVLAGAAIVAAGYLSNRLLGLMSRQKGEDHETSRLARTLSATLRWVLSVLVVVVAALLILDQLGMNTAMLWERIWAWILRSGVPIALIGVLAFVALQAARFVSTRALTLTHRGKVDLEFQKRAETLGSVIRYVLRSGIIAVAGLMILAELGVQIGPIIAAAGVVGLAVGFGAQNLVQDVISGFFILFEDQVRVGDVVQLDGRGGLVERITLRMIVLRDLHGNVHYVRNGKIDVVTNMTKEFSRYVFDIGVAYREDVDEVIKVIKEVDEDLRRDPEFGKDILQPIEVLGLDRFADSAIVIRARTTTKPIQQWRVGREFNRRLKKKFDALGIEIPFPHLTLYPGKDKKNNSPALKLEVTGPHPLASPGAESRGAEPDRPSAGPGAKGETA